MGFVNLLYCGPKMFRYNPTDPFPEGFALADTWNRAM